jgi:cyclopropane fatty-acyl-phospholipid synthase-like methyltransferase
VISFHAIHHHENEDKKKVFAKAFNCLNPDGLFVNGDVVAMETPEKEAAARKMHFEFISKNLAPEETVKWEKHIREQGRRAKLSDQKKWLDEIGFSSAEVAWQYFNFAVLVAVK